MNTNEPLPKITKMDARNIKAKYLDINAFIKRMNDNNKKSQQEMQEGFHLKVGRSKRIVPHKEAVLRDKERRVATSMTLKDLEFLSKALEVKYAEKMGYWYEYTGDEEQMERDLLMRQACSEYLSKADTILYLKSLVDAEIKRERSQK